MPICASFKRRRYNLPPALFSRLKNKAAAFHNAADFLIHLKTLNL